MQHHEYVKLISEPAFVLHKCRISDFSVLQEVSWFNLDLIRTSSAIPELMFVRPIEGWVNHLIWGGTFALGTHYIGGTTLEDHLNGAFGGSNHKILLTTLNSHNRFTVEAGRFTVQLAVDFLRWSGYQQEVLVIDSKGHRFFFLSDSQEYISYCRNPFFCRDPFDGITDHDLTIDFAADLEKFGIHNINAPLLDHIQSDLMPFFQEYGVWLHLAKRFGNST